MAVRIAPEDPFSAVSTALIAELSADLGARYGDEGDGNFQPQQVQGPGAGFLVAWLDDEAVGCGALRPTADRTTVEIKRMYVRPAARGQGVARQLLAALEALAREYGYSHTRLETGTLQPEAIRLYETSGYGRIPCYGDYADDPISVCFGKAL